MMAQVLAGMSNFACQLDTILISHMQTPLQPCSGILSF